MRKDKDKNKVQEINDQLRYLCQAKNVNLIDHSKRMKPQSLKKSRLLYTSMSCYVDLTIDVTKLPQFDKN